MKERTSDFTVGIFILSALLIFGLSIWVMGKDAQIFASQAPFYTAFDDVKGLKEGAPVRLGGIDIGRVDEVAFTDDPADSRVHVRFVVNDAYLERIREDSIVSIETQGLLGDQLLTVSPGMSPKRQRPMMYLKGKTPGDIGQVLDKAGEVVENIVQVSATVRDLTTAVKDNKGLINRLIYEEEAGSGIVEGASHIVEKMNGVLDAITTGQGLLNALVYGDQGTETLDAVQSAAKSFEDAAAAVSVIVTEIETGKGLLHALVYEENDRSVSKTLEKLDAIAADLREVSDALSKGSGTLGALLVDAKLYDNLVEITDGAKRSFLLRRAIRSSLKD